MAGSSMLLIIALIWALSNSNLEETSIKLIARILIISHKTKIRKATNFKGSSAPKRKQKITLTIKRRPKNKKGRKEKENKCFFNFVKKFIKYRY